MWRRTNRTARALVLGVAAVALVALAGALVWRLALRDTATPASVDEAVERFRQRAEDTGGRIPPGVYVYATTGFEYVSALGGTRHRYPARSTVTITRAPCGVGIRWDVLTTRFGLWTVCLDAGALRLSRWSEQHEFFGRTDRTDWRCEATWWLPPDSDPGSTSPWRCGSSDSRQDGTVTVVGTETVNVGTIPVRTVRIRTEARETGSARGPLVEERWLEPETGLPVRIVYRVRTTNPSLIGDVTFEEQYDLRLTSLEPQR